MNDVNAVNNIAAKKGSNKYIMLKKEVRVHKVYDKLLFSSNRQGAISFFYKVLSMPAEIIILETGMKVFLKILDKKEFTPEPGSMYMDYDKLTHPLVLRSRHPGDRFTPIGMKGRKKVKDYFIDMKIPLHQRDKTPILVSGEQVCAIVGYCISQNVVVNSSTSRILAIKKEG